MAIITIEVDTSKKSSTVKVDGKKMGDVSSIFMSLDDFFNVEISQIESLDDNTRKVTRIVANKVQSPHTIGLTDAIVNAKESERFSGMLEYQDKDFTTSELSTALLKRKVE